MAHHFAIISKKALKLMVCVWGIENCGNVLSLYAYVDIFPTGGTITLS